MKRFLFLLFFMAMAKLFAQRETVLNLPNFDKPRFHYGFYLGGNQNTFKISYKPTTFSKEPNITIKANYGFNLGLIGDMKINDNMNLRFEPGLISNIKTLVFNHIEGETYQREREISNTYFHLPLVMKFSVNRYVNIRPYVLGGVSYDYNFSSNESTADDNFSGEFRQKTHMFMYEIGIGMDFYLTYFKFSPSIRGLFVINNELVYDNKPSPWTSPIDYFGTRGLFIHLAFE